MCPDFFLGHSLPNCEYQKRLFLVSHFCQGQTAVLIIFLIKNKTSLVNNKNSQYTDSKVLKEKKLQDQHHHPPTDFPPSTLIFISMSAPEKHFTYRIWANYEFNERLKLRSCHSLPVHCLTLWKQASGLCVRHTSTFVLLIPSNKWQI